MGTRRRNDVDATSLRRIDVVTTSCACWEFGPPLAPQNSKPWPPNILNLPTPMLLNTCKLFAFLVTIYFILTIDLFYKDLHTTLLKIFKGAKYIFTVELVLKPEKSFTNVPPLPWIYDTLSNDILSAEPFRRKSFFVEVSFCRMSTSSKHVSSKTFDKIIYVHPAAIM